jgi:hypothetical protein
MFEVLGLLVYAWQGNPDLWKFLTNPVNDEPGIGLALLLQRKVCVNDAYIRKIRGVEEFRAELATQLPVGVVGNRMPHVLVAHPEICLGHVQK